MLQDILNKLNLDVGKEKSIISLVNNIKTLDIIKRVILYGSCADKSNNLYSVLEICILIDSMERVDIHEEEIIDTIYNIDRKGEDVYSTIDLTILPESSYYGLSDNKNKYGITLWKSA